MDVVIDWPQVLPKVEIPFREPRFLDGEMFFLFSKIEIKQSTEPFCFSVVLKFFRRQPSLDHARGLVKSRWGLRVLVVDQLKNP